MNTERCLALIAGSAIVTYGLRKRSGQGLLLAAAAAPLLYRGLSGEWPRVALGRPQGDTRDALAGARGIHVSEAIRLDVPTSVAYQYWRRLENLPRFMSHLESVTNRGNGRSHWVAKGPAGTRIEWDAEIINDVEDKVLAWRSLPGSDVVTAGSVNFDGWQSGESSQVTVRLQYAPPAGRVGQLVAAMFGRSPSQMIRADLWRFKDVLEGSIATIT